MKIGKILRNLGLTGILALSACGPEPINKDVGYNVETARTFRQGATYVIKSNDRSKSTWALDLDGDGTIDEAIRLRANIPLISNVYDVESNLKYLPKDKWEHLVARDFTEKSFFKTTDKTREMTSEERIALTGAYKILHGTQSSR